jgi:hypothetical protein
MDAQPDVAPALAASSWSFASLSLKFISAEEAALGKTTLAYYFEGGEGGGEGKGDIETLGPFTFNEEAQILTFTRYRNDPGSTVVFGTSLDPFLVSEHPKWQWGNTFMDFVKPNKVKVGSKTYNYSYNSEENSGEIVNLGSFALSEDYAGLTITNYKGFEFDASFNAWHEGDPIITMNDTLEGTEWFWASQYGGTMFFVTRKTIDGGRGYTWDPATRKGSVDVLGPFFVQENDTHLTFTNIKGYGHTAEFYIQ